MSLNLLVDSSGVRPAVWRGCVVPADPCMRLLSASHVGDSMEHATNAMSLGHHLTAALESWKKTASTMPAFVGHVELMLGCCGAFFVNVVITM